MVETAYSPNHGGVRASTVGCVIHSTRGGAKSYAAEYQATLDWFARVSSQVSAHAVIAWDGTLALVVPPDLEAWHCRELNASHLGAELVQPNAGDPISEDQLQSLAAWLRAMAARYAFPLDLAHLPEHQDTAPGIADWKTDVGAPYAFSRLAAYL